MHGHLRILRILDRQGKREECCLSDILIVIFWMLYKQILFLEVKISQKQYTLICLEAE